MIDARQKVFGTFSLTATWAPVVGELMAFANDGRWSPSVASSVVLFVVNGGSYLYYRRTRDPVTAFRWSSWASLACLAWSAYLHGGVRADHYDFVYLFIFANVFFYGNAAALWSTAVVMALTLSLAALEYFDMVPTVAHPLGALTAQFLGCEALAAWAIYHVETARQRAASEAAYQRELLQSTFDHSPIIHFAKDVAGRYLQVNRALGKAMGVTPERLIGRLPEEFVSASDAAMIHETEQAVIRSGQPQTFERAVTINGQFRLYTSTLFPIHNADGSVRGLGGILLDNHEALVHAAENKAFATTLNETALVLTADADGAILSANDNFCAISGYSRSELIGRTKFDHPPVFENNLFAVIRQALKANRSWTAEIHEVTRDGREYYLGAAIAPIAGIGEMPARFLVVCFDITPQILAENQYRSLVETMEEGVIIWDEHGSVVQTNSSARRIMDVDYDEMRDRETLSKIRVITSEDGTLLPPEHYPAAQALRRGSGLANVVVGVQTRTGEQRWVSINTKPSVIGGRRVVVATLTDVTAQRQTLRELEVRADELHSLFEAMTEGMYVIDELGKIVMVNRAATEILGYTREDLIGTVSHILLHHSHPDGRHYDIHECPLYASLQDGVTRASELDHFWTKDRRAVPVSTISVPIKSGDRVTGALITFRDLTELKRLEDQVKHEQAKSFQNAKLASLGEMSAGIAHEINNPLAIVTGSLEMLRRYREEPEKFDAKIQAINKAAARITKIVRGLQKFARATPGQEYRVESLGVIVADSVVMTETKARRHDVRVSAEVSGEHLITCDVVEIEQVLINLINNAVDAIKSAAERWVTLTTNVEGPHLVLRVTDSGPGITAETEAKLFQPFFTTKPVGQGTGLGLSIAKGIIEQHGATIAVDHRSPHTCFELRFTKWERASRAA